MVEGILSLPKTFTGNRALMLEEPLIFERQSSGGGVDIDDKVLDGKTTRLGELEREDNIGLPDLSEPDVVRHFVRLSQKNYAIDSGIFPLGSCTMKHNPRLNEKMARLDGFADIHPLQPTSTVSGALALMDMLAHWLKTLTGMPGIALSPKAGAHGELCGLMTIGSALEARGERSSRTRVLVADSAHGTNPATAALLGFDVTAIPTTPDGRMDVEAFGAEVDKSVAAVMLTNPNTCGLFERDCKRIADDIHEIGGYFYCDGANFNAMIGKVRPSDLGVDAMHLNLHKSCSTPHGGGGPGSGPVVFSEALTPYIPVPFVIRDNNGYKLVEQIEDAGESMPFGRLAGFHGQMGMFVRAMAWLMSHGADGLRQVAEDAVLNANYIMSRLQDVMTTPFEGPCMHEAIFDDRFLKAYDIETLDFAKAMIDEGYHPMTIYFPLTVSGAMLVEPTESESRASLDLFIDTMRHLASIVQSGKKDLFTKAPVYAPRRRLDDTAAARNPVLRWHKRL
ncbi:MAG: aminomethyl-transferring glycine dehydrogenase subunit GcvPB [Parvularculales bacterium]